MEIFSVWKYLDNVWVVSGWVLVMLISLLKMLSVDNLNNRKTKQQMYKGINYLLVLSLTGMALSSLFSQNSNLTALQQAGTDLFDFTSIPNQDHIDAKSQSISNDSSTAVNTAGSADFDQLLHVMPDRTRSERPNTVNQQIRGDSGAINPDEDDFH